ncbi:hypothetical protein HYH02_001795 [Chlamydomonas schloesseri]|uniref:Uncharacterized protein n=1 Tax=Chlamydomonas schloesseri TaxID=2026947 RepID=A0A836BBH4_9CHLO|nr:hypothetical protein HYH02_001795 [Chlamydomonas schloesseri]|eukprot:KAG2453577.1 hypothetical protein HYH02_001795 [Chlamydomonas schloesseri]
MLLTLGFATLCIPRPRHLVPALGWPSTSRRIATIRLATSRPYKGTAGEGGAKPRKATPPKPPTAADLPWAASRAKPDAAAAAPAAPAAPKPEPAGAGAQAEAAAGPAPAPAAKRVRKAASPSPAAGGQAADPAQQEEQRPRRHLNRGKQRYNGGEGQEAFSFRPGYADPEDLGWRYTGHDSRITAAYYENDDSGIKIDAFYNTGTIKMSHPRPAPPPGGQARKGPPPTSYHTKLSATQWHNVLTSPPPAPADEEQDGGDEALGEDELPFEFPRGYADPVDLDWEYVGAEPALKVAFYERQELGGKVLRLHAFYTSATIKLVFPRASKRTPPEHPPVYFRRLRAGAWRQPSAAMTLTTYESNPTGLVIGRDPSRLGRQQPRMGEEEQQRQQQQQQREQPAVPETAAEGVSFGVGGGGGDAGAGADSGAAGECSVGPVMVLDRGLPRGTAAGGAGSGGATNVCS